MHKAHATLLYQAQQLPLVLRRNVLEVEHAIHGSHHTAAALNGEHLREDNLRRSGDSDRVVLGPREAASGIGSYLDVFFLFAHALFLR